MNTSFIILGSNIDPWNNVNAAIKLINSDTEMKIVKRSNFYETIPTHNYGDNFINVAIKLESSLGIIDLNNRFKMIEKVMGRRRTDDKNEARTIDIDIIFFNNIVTKGIPDRDFFRFAHIAVPTIELDPTFIHPVTKKQILIYKEKFLQYIGKTIFLIE